MHTVKISVRQLVEFILRSGDIDASYAGASRALLGTRVHQHVQRRRLSEAKEKNAVYKREVLLYAETERSGIVYQVEGRADGLWTDGNGVTLDEIKSTLAAPPREAPGDGHWHFAQAKSYGYLYLAALPESERPEGLNVALIYCQIDTEETHVYTRRFPFSELEDAFMSLLDRYADFARMNAETKKELEETAKALAFPYGAYRAGQREMAVAVYAAIKKTRRLFAQAPTGTGKTVSVLFPAVKALAEGLGDRIFYLTAKTVARRTAEETLRDMAANGLRIRAVTLTAKDKICPMSPRRCQPEFCAFARGHFDRVNAAVLDMCRHETLMTRETVEAYARAHRVCPFEFQLDAALFAGVIIGDFNHAYDPKVRLGRFFSGKGDHILLNDEAHNLSERARDMFSAGLYRHDFTALRKELPNNRPLKKAAGAVLKAMREAREGREEPFTRAKPPEALLTPLNAFAALADETLKTNEPGPQTERLLELYFTVLDYLRVSELYDGRYAFYCEPASGYIRLMCLDASALLAVEYAKARAAVFFSATLSPLEYFRAVLGGSEEDYLLRLASPFARGNLCLLVDRRVSTRYKDRADSLEAVAERLYTLTAARAGNYMAFFPSYVYLSQVLAVFAGRYPGVKTLAQTPEMDEENRGAFLAAFFSEPPETSCGVSRRTGTGQTESPSLLAFAVLGGVFSEGINLTGEQLIGAAIIGVGLPMLSPERDVLKAYYDKANGQGYDYAYRLPGMNKVMQAAGRVIRSETDRGVVLLIDSRYAEPAYTRLFPREWEGYAAVRDTKSLQGQLHAFWSRAYDA